MKKIKGIIQLDGLSGGEGQYIGVVSNEVQDFKGGYYANTYDITHLHYCSNSSWAVKDCFNGEQYQSMEMNNNFFTDKKWSGNVLEGLHFTTMDFLKDRLLLNL